MGFRRTKASPPVSSMENSSLFQNNTIQLTSTSNRIAPYVHLTFITLIAACLFFFIYFIAVVLKIFFTSPQLREYARYVLFVHLLTNDLTCLLCTFIIIVSAVYVLYMPMSVCYILHKAAAVAYRVTPATLAAIALEKYVAICHPLRHMDLCTPQRANAAFSLICTALTIQYVVEFFYMPSSYLKLFNINVVCTREILIVNSFLDFVGAMVLVSCFVLVAIVILFTYVEITKVARKASSQSSVASKARTTILLHAFQLLLCTGALLSPVTQYFPDDPTGFTALFPFFLFNCVPRFLSPIIYGVRDDHLRKLLKKIRSPLSRKMDM